MVNIQITSSDIERYVHDGFIHLHQVLDENKLKKFAKKLSPLMTELNPNTEALEDRSTYKQAFTQVTNLWQQSEFVREFIFNQQLAQLAANIMGVKGVRLYHDQALYKEAGGGATPWHVDQVYWPLDTTNTCTFWIPLQNTSLEMGSLAFARGSHRMTSGRDMLISEESESVFAKLVKKKELEVICDAFEFGDISVHNGWTVHNAGPNLTATPREVMTIIYMAEDTSLLRKPSETQLVDRDAFVPGIRLGQKAASALNPVLYSQEN